jgi:maleate isomerase/arylmalonate decarboxylase
MIEHRHQSTYSYRAKLGLIVPPTNTVNEAEWARLMPTGVTFHTHRMPLHPGANTPEGRAELLQDLSGVVGLLKQARIDIVAYACTAGSMINPVNALPDEITARNGVAAVTTSAAIITALKELGVRRLSVATPYHAALNDHEAHFLEENGFIVERLIGLGIGAGGPSEYPLIAQTPLEKVRETARTCFVPGSEAMLLTCTDFPTLPLITALEAEFDVPVVTSNQATLWASLRAAGIPDSIGEAGILLSRH